MREIAQSDEIINISRISDPYDGTKVIVRNLNEDVSTQDIKDLFEPMGTLNKAEVEYDRSGRSLGSAVLIFAKRRDAESAVSKYNGILLDNKPMEIFIVERRSVRGGGDGGGLRIGTSSDGHRRVIVSSSRGGYGRGGGFRGGRGSRGGRRRDRKIPTKEELDSDIMSFTSSGMQMMDINV